MPYTYYPAVIHPADESGYWAVIVPALAINIQGEDEQSTLNEAVNAIQEIVDVDRKNGQAIAPPQRLTAEDLDGGREVLLPVTLPARPERVNVSLPTDLLERIDATTSNRSGFLAEAALEKLRR